MVYNVGKLNVVIDICDLLSLSNLSYLYLMYLTSYVPTKSQLQHQASSPSYQFLSPNPQSLRMQHIARVAPSLQKFTKCFQRAAHTLIHLFHLPLLAGSCFP